MDIDAFSALRRERWERLQRLARTRRRTGAEVDEMTRLYRSTASDLSAVRSAAPEPALVTRLSMLLGQSRVWLTGSHAVRGADVRAYLTSSLPAALYRVRWWGVAVSLLVVAGGALSAWHTLNTPEALELVGNYETRQIVAEEEFANYYTNYDSTSFGAQVWTNNAWLAAQCIFLGITGFYPLILMYNTVIQLGVNAAIMAEFGGLDIFFALIIPHGLLELSAVFVAAGAGLKMFWTMLVPGDRPRSRALSEEFLGLMGVTLGLTITLFISALIEGYITGSDMYWWLKIAIGSVAFAAFWAYIFVAGRLATRAGDVGRGDADFAVEAAPVAA